MSLNTKGIMAAVVVLTMVLGFVAVGTYSDDSEATATHTVSTKAEFDIAFDDYGAGDTIKLGADIDLNTNGYNVTKTLTLDLNGHKIDSKSTDQDHRTFKVTGEANFSVIDSSASKSGSINAVGTASGSSQSGAYGTIKFDSKGKLTISDVKLTNAPDTGGSRTWGLNVKMIQGTGVFTNVTIESSYGGCVEVSSPDLDGVSSATLVLNNCTFNQENLDTVSKWISSAVCVSGKAVIIVNGGSYSAACSPIYVYSSGGTITINDGTFTAGEHMAVAETDHSTYDTATSTIIFNGGKFAGTASDSYFKVKDAQYDKIEITKGIFSDLSCNNYLKSPASGDVTVKLEKNQTLTTTLNVSENLTIDLNGHSITGSNIRAIHVMENTLILTGSGTVTCSGSMSDSSSVIRVGDTTGTSAGLEIGKNVTVTTTLSYTVTIFGAETNGQTLTVKGTVSLTGTDAAAISGNGSSNLKETTITIEDGAKVTATSGSAIYHPQAGTLNIAGTVSGPSGLEIKAGGCNVNLLDTAIITATSSTTTHVKNGNGNSTTGYSIAVVENSGYKGNPTLNLSKGTLVGPVALVADDVVTDKKGSITISGGTVKGTISLVNTSETGGTPPAGSITITGGTFSEDPTQFVPEGYIVVQDGEGNYIVGTAVTVTFDSNGGSAVESQTVIFGQKIMKPSDPTKDGYVFKGWYNEGLTEAYDFDTKVIEDITLYAKWEETTKPLHTVTFMDGTDVFYSTQVEDGKMVPKPTEPTKDNYRFSGWYADVTLSAKFDFTTKIVEDTPLYAGGVQLCYVSIPAGVDGIFTTTNSGVNLIDLSTTTQFTFTVTAAYGYELEVYANDEQLTPSGDEYIVTDLSKNVDILICNSKGTEEVQAIETVVENDDGTVTESSAVATVDTATDRIDVKETSVVKDGETTKSSSTTTATIAGSTASISIVTTDAETATISAVVAEAVSITGSPVSVNVVVETPKVVIPKGLLTSKLVTDLTVNLNTGSSNQATITIPVGAIAAEDIADSFALSVTASSATPSSSDIRGSYAIDAFDLGLTGTNTTVFDKPVTVSYDVTLPSDAKNVRVYCIDEGRFYDATYSNGTVVFTIPHFSA